MMGVKLYEGVTDMISLASLDNSGPPRFGDGQNNNQPSLLPGLRTYRMDYGTYDR